MKLFMKNNFKGSQFMAIFSEKKKKKKKKKRMEVDLLPDKLK